MIDVIREIKKGWGWTGIDPVKVVAENEFGNLIVADREGKYWRLCPEDVYCKVIAQTDADYESLLKDTAYLEDWRMTNLVESAREALGELAEGRKYHLVIPGPLGGKYDISNIKTVPLLEMIGFSGDIGLQIRDLPDGEEIRLKVID